MSNPYDGTVLARCLEEYANFGVLLSELYARFKPDAPPI
jgi:hypothetical protein